MIGLAPRIALKHLLARRRQSLVSLSGIVLGVAFFLAVSSLMQGSEHDFIRRLVDNSPHITIQDEFRNPRLQPVQQLYPGGAIEIRRVKPLTETRGIRGYPQIPPQKRRLNFPRVQRRTPWRRSGKSGGAPIADDLIIPPDRREGRGGDPIGGARDDTGFASTRAVGLGDCASPQECAAHRASRMLASWVRCAGDRAGSVEWLISGHNRGGAVSA
jgi:hypothetical protein